jgi:hypothetical protein
MPTSMRVVSRVSVAAALPKSTHIPSEAPSSLFQIWNSGKGWIGNKRMVGLFVATARSVVYSFTSLDTQSFIIGQKVLKIIAHISAQCAIANEFETVCSFQVESFKKTSLPLVGAWERQSLAPIHSGFISHQR